MSSTEINEIHWSETALRNKFLMTPISEMLNDDGYYLMKHIRAKGSEKQAYLVHYDRDYVVQFLANRLRGLKTVPTPELHDLLSEALLEAKYDV